MMSEGYRCLNKSENLCFVSLTTTGQLWILLLNCQIGIHFFNSFRKKTTKLKLDCKITDKMTPK